MKTFQEFNNENSNERPKGWEHQHIDGGGKEVTFKKIKDLIPTKHIGEEKPTRELGKTFHPIVVDINNKIIDGHHRLKEAIAAGHTHIPTVKSPLTIEQYLKGFGFSKG